MKKTFALLKYLSKTDGNLILQGFTFSLLYSFLWGFFVQAEISHEMFFLVSWIGTLYTLLLASSNLYQKDFQDGFLVLALSHNFKISNIFIAKLLFIFINFLVPSSASCFLMGVFLNVELSVILSFYAGLYALSLGLISLIHVSSLFLAHTKTFPFLGSILLIPFLIPIVIFGVSLSLKTLEGLTFTPLLLSCLGVNIIYSMTSWLLSKALLRSKLS